MPGVLIVETGGSSVVTEGGGTDTYTVVLTSQPSADVSIAITVDVETTVAPTALLFTSTNWNVPQVVTITAVNDTDNEGLHSGLITHTVSSTDPNYNGISAASITVTVIDNDAPVPNVRLNEIYVNPLDIDDSREFVEIELQATRRSD